MTAWITTGDGCTLAALDWGEGSPVVFLHGGQLGAGMWEYQMLPLVNDGLRCIAYDRRGCGRSGHSWRGYDADTLANDLAAVMAHFDLRGATLVGHSQGCANIGRYLSRHGAGRAARAVLISPILPELTAKCSKG